MSVSGDCSRVCARRITLGAIVTGCLLVGILWLFHGTQSNVALAVIPVAKDNAPSTSQAPHRAGEAPSDKPTFSAAEIKARFPESMHQEFMRRAIANSRKAGVEYKTGGAFGAVIVNRKGEVLSDGLNHVIAQNDPTWHAEMHAIRQACALLRSPKLDGCVLYTSSEPCPMCLATAYWAGLDGIIYGATVADSKKYGNFDDAFIYQEFQKPIDGRSIPEQSLMRPEAVEIWKQYEARTDKIDY